MVRIINVYHIRPVEPQKQHTSFTKLRICQFMKYTQIRLVQNVSVNIVKWTEGYSSFIVVLSLWKIEWSDSVDKRYYTALRGKIEWSDSVDKRYSYCVTWKDRMVRQCGQTVFKLCYAERYNGPTEWTIGFQIVLRGEIERLSVYKWYSNCDPRATFIVPPIHFIRIEVCMYNFDISVQFSSPYLCIIGAGFIQCHSWVLTRHILLMFAFYYL